MFVREHSLKFVFKFYSTLGCDILQFCRYHRCSGTHLPSCLVSRSEDHNLIITITRTKNLVLIFYVHLFYDIILYKIKYYTEKQKLSYY